MDLIVTNNDKFLQYRVSTGSDVIQLKDSVGKMINIKDIIQNKTTNQDGEDVIATSIVDRDGNVYQTLSPTVSDCCRSMYTIFGDEWGHIELIAEVVEKKSNSGNRFLSLALTR